MELGASGWLRAIGERIGVVSRSLSGVSASELLEIEMVFNSLG